MSTFHRQTAIRIATVSLVLAALASPIAWFVAREQTEKETVAMAMEESARFLNAFDARKLAGDNALLEAADAARVLSSGLFDIAEIYDTQGNRLAEAMTEAGKAVESRLPEHSLIESRRASYESLKLGKERQWILRAFIPLVARQVDEGEEIYGYFEGVRIVSAWQEEQLSANALNAALMVGLASILCGAVLYPVVIRLSAENERRAHQVLESHLSIMEALGRAIAKRDSGTGAHNQRVAWIATRIAEQMGIHGYAMQSLIVGSFLHDVGKVGVPDAILLKPGGLDAEELKVMRRHVQQGEDIVSGIGWLDGASEVVAAHHEKWDGSGYPRHLAGENIPITARIFAVADVFDALCSSRPYKVPMAFEAVMDILEKDAGSHFDPAVIEAFRPIARSIHQRLNGISEDEARALLNERVRYHFGL